MNRLLTRAEERAEAALWRARHAIDFCSCEAGFVFCMVDRCAHPAQRAVVREPSPSLLHHLIDIGRVYP